MNKTLTAMAFSTAMAFMSGSAWGWTDKGGIGSIAQICITATLNNAERPRLRGERRRLNGHGGLKKNAGGGRLKLNGEGEKKNGVGAIVQGCIIKADWKTRHRGSCPIKVVSG